MAHSSGKLNTAIWAVLSFLIGGILTAGCGEVSKTTIHNEATFGRLAKAKNIRVKHIDGREATFYRMEVDKVDDQFIYARCWKDKDSEAVEYKFNKQEVVIESVAFSGSKTANYVFGTIISVGLLVLLSILLAR